MSSFCLALTACQPPLHAYLYPDGGPELLEAAGLLGVELVEDTGRRGVVRVGGLRVCDHRADGLSLDVRGCDRAVQADPNPVAIAHELGHALGLDHAPAGLMARRPSGELGLSPDQRDTIAAELRSLEVCR